MSDPMFYLLINDQRMKNLNEITHIEIPVTDLYAAEQFYKKVFGFNLNTKMMPNYGLVNDKEVSIGMPLVDSIEHPERGIYIRVENIDKTLELVNKYGGKTISEKNLISDQIGFGAKFSDFCGNNIGLFSPD